MNHNSWYRHYHGTVEDARLGMVAKKSGLRRCEITAFWECLLEHASQHVKRGYVGDIDLEVIAFSQEIDLERLRNAYVTLCNVTCVTDGYIKNWEKRQYDSVTRGSVTRVRKHRAKLKACKDDVTHVTDVTLVTHREEENREEYKKESSSNKLLSDSSPPKNENPIVDEKKVEQVKRITKPEKIIFDFSTGKFSGITSVELVAWGEAYPALDIKAEIRRMEAWLVSNPEQKKSKYSRFINRWLSIQQDRWHKPVFKDKTERKTFAEIGKEKNEEVMRNYMEKKKNEQQ